MPHINDVFLAWHDRNTSRSSSRYVREPSPNCLQIPPKIDQRTPHGNNAHVLRASRVIPHLTGLFILFLGYLTILCKHRVFHGTEYKNMTIMNAVQNRSKNSEGDGRDLFQRILSAFPSRVSSQIVTSYI
jgi:hypothetical protein